VAALLACDGSSSNLNENGRALITGKLREAGALQRECSGGGRKLRGTKHRSIAASKPMVAMEEEGDCRRGRWSVRRVLLRDWGPGLGFWVLGAGLWPRIAADVRGVCSKGGRRRWN
jgi:hypothetical protein